MSEEVKTIVTEVVPKAKEASIGKVE